jgi:probable phosphomutase (TIGR03848 family)
MTRIVLLRHAHSIANGKGILAGRAPGVKLSEKGEVQAKQLAEMLEGLSFSEIRISPMERCQMTVTPLIESLKARSAKVTVTVDADLTEVDYGNWTGKKLTSLYRRKLWKTVQNKPSAMYFPDGEGLAEMQHRAMRALHSAVAKPSTSPKILVSHGDVIKSIVASVLGTHLDHFQKIVIDPASITILDHDGSDFRVLTLNQTSSGVASSLKVEKRSSGARALLGGGAGRGK